MVTKRPHYVPAGYLRAWADNETVCRRRRDRAISFPTNVKNLAVEAGIYGTGSLGQAREDTFRQTEDDWPALGRRLTSTGDLHRNDRTVVALFTAIQLIRTRESLARSNFIAEVEAAWTMVQYATDQDNPPSRDEMLSIMLKVAVTELAPRLEKMQWTVEHCSVPMLMTSDRPVMMWRAEPVILKFWGQDHWERSWMCPCASGAVVVRTTVLHTHFAGSSAGRSGFGHSSHSPAIARTPSPCKKCGTLAPSRFSHSKYPGGTIARRRQAATLNEGLVVMVSIRALINRDPILVSRAQD